MEAATAEAYDLSLLWMLGASGFIFLGLVTPT